MVNIIIFKNFAVMYVIVRAKLLINSTNYARTFNLTPPNL